MKYFIAIALLFLAGCSTCNIPAVEFSSFGASEVETNLSLSTYEYILTSASWSPGNYENRITSEARGVWSCDRDYVTFKTDEGKSKAEYKKIGENPLGLLEDTKALIFDFSSVSILSNEILYKKSDIE